MDLCNKNVYINNNVFISIYKIKHNKMNKQDKVFKSNKIQIQI